jgi:hypothetical protein
MALWKPGERPVGRAKGTLNKSTAKVQAFLAEVFEEAFARPEFKQTLVESIASLSIDSKLLSTLLAYYAGRPPQALDVTHGGAVTLAEIIAGRIPKDEDADGDTEEEPVH